MNRKVFLFLAAAVMMVVSCLKEEMPQPQDEGMYFTFEAAREALNDPSSAPASQHVGSKTVLVDNNKVEWVKNDKVGVYNGINETGTDKVSAVDSDGATFKAEVEAEMNVSVDI